jgi:hypothetical protein
VYSVCLPALDSLLTANMTSLLTSARGADICTVTISGSPVQVVIVVVVIDQSSEMCIVRKY